MSEVHTYNSQFVTGGDLQNSDTLVGESGGLSSVYEVNSNSGLVMGCVAVVTEHGTLYLDPDNEYEILERV